jgi:hypothetical protein
VSDRGHFGTAIYSVHSLVYVIRISDLKIDSQGTSSTNQKPRDGVFQPVRQPSDEEALDGHFHLENLIVAFARGLQTSAKGRLFGSTRPSEYCYRSPPA